MNLTELHAALAAAKAAGDTAKVASLEAKIASFTARAEEDSEEEDSDEDAEEDSDEDAAEDDDDDGDEDDDDEPEEEEEETRRSTTTKTYRRSKKSAESVAAAVEEVFPGLSAAQVRGKLMALKDGQGRVEKLERQVKTVKTQQRNEEARKLVAQGIKSGKIPPSQREFWMAQATKKDGIASLREYLKTAVPVVATADSSGIVPSPDMPGPNGLSAQDLEICARMNVDPKLYAEQKKTMGNGTTGLAMVRN